MKKYKVLIGDEALKDLGQICDYIAQYDSPEKADAVLERFEAVISELTSLPHRGSRPKELEGLGLNEYRQVYFKPYRVIYRILEKAVRIELVIDGRRDMMPQMIRRLFTGNLD